MTTRHDIYGLNLRMVDNAKLLAMLDAKEKELDRVETHLNEMWAEVRRRGLSRAP